MHRCPVFYSSLPDIGAGFKPVESEDSYEAEQMGRREYPDSINGSLISAIHDDKSVVLRDRLWRDVSQTVELQPVGMTRFWV